MEFRPFGGSDKEIRQVGTISLVTRTPFVHTAFAETDWQSSCRHKSARSSLDPVEHSSNVAGVTKGILLFAGVGVGAPAS